jgi:predicted RNA polymerase sigma factor
MLLLDARRAARVDGEGRLVPLALQDRASWDRDRVAEGTALLEGALSHGRLGEYQLQAVIAEAHDRAGSADETDWPRILAVYGLLERVTDNPVVTLNRAVALAMVDGPEEGLALLETVRPRLERHGGTHRLYAVRAHLLELAGEPDAAREDYLAAAARTTSLPEQRHLTEQAARLGTPAADALAEGR